MTQVTAEEIQKKIETLPPDIQALVYSADMHKTLIDIANKHHLHIDQVGKLETEAAAVMIGLTNQNSFVSELADALDLDTTKAEELVRDINDQLFLKIRESMKKLYSASPTPNTARTASTPQPVRTAVPTPATQVPAMTTPAKAPELHPADMMLSQPTVSAAPPAPPKPAAPPAATAPAAKPEPPKPGPYKADPYREPPV